MDGAQRLSSERGAWGADVAPPRCRTRNCCLRLHLCRRTRQRRRRSYTFGATASKLSLLAGCSACGCCPLFRWG
ncbi:unnamed protein product [Pleuronectes platessa]|uniref:Uncharacterized protein n=1 Tax=Pleuronectes platessa TaxID=8262 RepID=A0A9N7VNK0_PLEPL|nr:unnamed protein product [Pleuronectes platessa]